MHRASVHQAAKLVAALLRVARVTAGLAESNGSLPSGLWLMSHAGWPPRTGISSGTLRSVIEYRLPLTVMGHTPRRRMKVEVINGQGYQSGTAWSYRSYRGRWTVLCHQGTCRRWDTGSRHTRRCWSHTCLPCSQVCSHTWTSQVCWRTFRRAHTEDANLPPITTTISGR